MFKLRTPNKFVWTYKFLYWNDDEALVNFYIKKLNGALHAENQLGIMLCGMDAGI